MLKMCSGMEEETFPYGVVVFNLIMLPCHRREAVDGPGRIKRLFKLLLSSVKLLITSLKSKPRWPFRRRTHTFHTLHAHALAVI